jgi:hypothetical protein
MPNYYATAGELGYSSSQLPQTSQKEVYLTPKEQESLWTITNASQLRELMSSKREKAMGKEFCSKKKTTDDWNRPADINSILYYSCPGDNPTIAIDRENRVSRLAYDQDYMYPSGIPLGLQI